MRTCLELCNEFPVEKVLIGLIEYSEAMEESMLESKINDVEELLISYLVHPAKEVRFNGKITT